MNIKRRKKFNPNSIAVKYFVVTCIFIIVPILVFFILAQRFNTGTVLEQKRRSDLSTLNAFASSIREYMSSIETIASLIIHDEAVSHFISDASSSSAVHGKTIYKELDSSSCLAPFSSINTSILATGLTDASGLFIGEHKLNPDRLSYFFHDFFTKNGPILEPVWTNTFSIEFQDTGQVKKVLAHLTPITDKTGNISGYLVLFLDTLKFSELLTAYADDIYVLENVYIIGSKREVPVNTSLYSFSQINYGLLLNDNCVIIDQKDDSLVVTTKVFPQLDFHLLLISSYRELRNNSAIAYPNLFTVMLWGIFFAVVSSLIIARFQAKPIFYLIGIMEHVKEGDFHIRFHSKAKDEISELGFTFNSLLDKVQTLMDEQKEHQKRKQKMEMQMLQEQVKPHFLYNVLEMTSSLIRCSLYQEAMDTLENLASFYRISLNNGSNIITVKDEIQLVENYLHLQKMRYIEFMDYMVAFSPNIYDYSVPKLTLQPLVENAIYHGIKEKGETGILCVAGYLDNQRVVFEIYDTGTGISPQKIKELEDAVAAETDISNHFGLASVVKRLNIHYNNQAKLLIESKLSEYTCVTVSFPAEK